MHSKSIFTSTCIKIEQNKTVSFDKLSIEYDIKILEIRRRLQDMYWHKLLNSCIVRPKILSKIPLNIILVNTRVSHMFYTSIHCFNYSKFVSLNRMLTSGSDSLLKHFDFFYNNSVKLKLGTDIVNRKNIVKCTYFN